MFFFVGYPQTEFMLYSWVPNHSKDYRQHNLLQGFKVAVLSSNLYFRTIRKHGVFIPSPDRDVVVRAGQDMVDTLFNNKYDFECYVVLCFFPTTHPCLSTIHPCSENQKPEEAYGYLASKCHTARMKSVSFDNAHGLWVNGVFDPQPLERMYFHFVWALLF